MKDYIKISDTDSLFVSCYEIIEKLKGLGFDINDSNVDLYVLKIANKIEEKANNNLEDVCTKLYNINTNKYFKLKQEVIVKKLLITGKRRYGMHITNKEGVHVDEVVLMGLEIMKSNQNPLFKEFGTQFIKNILFGKPKEELDSSIVEFYKSLKNTEPKLLGKPSGVSYINKCIKRSPTAGEIFSDLNINTKENSRGAIYYNDLLKFKKLDKKYESIIEGDKIYIINLKENPYKIDVIGLPNATIPEDIITFINEYIDVDAIFESALLKKLKELYNDLNWEFPNLNPNVSKFFSF